MKVRVIEWFGMAKGQEFETGDEHAEELIKQGKVENAENTSKSEAGKDTKLGSSEVLSENISKKRS